jgi:hypothetical protein
MYVCFAGLSSRHQPRVIASGQQANKFEWVGLFDDLQARRVRCVRRHNWWGGIGLLTGLTASTFNRSNTIQRRPEMAAVARFTP